MAEIIVAEDLVAEAAAWLAERIAASTGIYRIALAGGSTPRPIYERLAGMDLPWKRVQLFLGDERDVPIDSPDSNHKMTTTALKQPVTPFIKTWLPPRLDLMILGVGEDFHTLSLFPNRAHRGAPVLVVEDAPKPPPRRLTLSADVVDDAAELVVIASGAGKAPIVRDTFHLVPADTALRPIQLALRGTWIVDRAAASLL
jgi:6-phosphogluconolactonase